MTTMDKNTASFLRRTQPVREPYKPSTADRNELLRFLAAWWRWVELGADRHHPYFARYRSLCVSARYAMLSGDFHRNLADTLRETLIEQFGNTLDPFNARESDYEFGQEISEKRMHTNPRRLEWVADMLRGTGYVPADFDELARRRIKHNWDQEGVPHPDIMKEIPDGEV